MSFKIAPFVKETTTSTGTGAIVPAGAVSGFQTFASFLSDGDTTHLIIHDANGAKEESLSTYTASGTTLSRTLLSSTTGSLLSLSAGTHTIFCGFPATIAGRLLTATNLVTGADAATTCVANTTYVVDMSAWATADRNYTMPASPTVGDRVSIIVQLGNASFELLIKGNTSQTINGGSAASEWSRLFITGEVVTLRYVASNTWIVEYDGRIPMKGLLQLTTNCSGESAATSTYPTAKSGVWTANKNTGSVCTTASDKITARRACSAYVAISASTANQVVVGGKFDLFMELNGGATIFPQNLQITAGLTAYISTGVSGLYVFAVDDYIRFQYRTSAGSIGLYGSSSDTETFMSLTEVF